MLDKISENILLKLKNCGVDVSDIDFNELVDRQVGSLMRPKVNISMNTGSFPKITMNGYKEVVVINLFLVVQNLMSEKARRFDNYRLIDAIVHALLLEKLDLPLQDALKPIGFSNVTDEEFAGAGYSLYQLDFTCSFNYVKPADPEDNGELVEIINNYYMDPDLGVKDLTGIVDLSDIVGGTAFSEDFIRVIDGGSAGSDFEDFIYGGVANSTYGA